MICLWEGNENDVNYYSMNNIPLSKREIGTSSFDYSIERYLEVKSDLRMARSGGFGVTRDRYVIQVSEMRIR